MKIFLAIVFFPFYAVFRLFVMLCDALKMFCDPLYIPQHPFASNQWSRKPTPQQAAEMMAARKKGRARAYRQGYDDGYYEAMEAMEAYSPEHEHEDWHA